MVVCPSTGSCPSLLFESAKNERGRGGTKTKSKKKKVVGSGVVVLAHARCDEGQGSILLNYAKLYSN